MDASFQNTILWIIIPIVWTTGGGSKGILTSSLITTIFCSIIFSSNGVTSIGSAERKNTLDNLHMLPSRYKITDETTLILMFEIMIVMTISRSLKSRKFNFYLQFSCTMSCINCIKLLSLGHYIQKQSVKVRLGKLAWLELIWPRLC